MFKKSLKENVLTSNPVFVSFLGMCPALAVTGTISDAFAMFLAFTLVTIMSNVLISFIKELIPSTIRIPVFITIIAGFVTIVEMSMQAYAFQAYQSISLYISLIVVNCIVLGRAEAFASKNNVGASAIDGLTTGLGFGGALFLIATFREVLGTGSFNFSNPLNGETLVSIEFAADYAISILASPSGGFLAIGLLAGIIGTVRISYMDPQKVKLRNLKKLALAGNAGARKAYETMSGKTLGAVKAPKPAAKPAAAKGGK